MYGEVLRVRADGRVRARVHFQVLEAVVLLRARAANVSLVMKNTQKEVQE